MLLFTVVVVRLISAQDATRVVLRVNIFDPAGRSVTGLKPEDFRIRENGVERKVLSATVSDEPASVVIMIDVSDSFDRYRRRLATGLLLKSIEELNPRNEYLVFAFGNKPYTLIDWKTPRESLKSKLVELAEISGRGEQTSLYDAIVTGIEKVESGRLSRKLLVVVTDGQDSSSKTLLKDLKTKVKHLDFPIYSMGIMASRELGSFEAHYGLASLNEIVVASGGYDLGRLLNYDDPEFAMKFASGLNSQYSIEWETTTSKTDLKWREVDIKVVAPELKKKAKKLRVISRAGYFPTTSSEER